MHLEGMREDGIRPPKPSVPEFFEVTELPAAASHAFRVESITPHVKNLIADATMYSVPTSRPRKSTAKKSAGRKKIPGLHGGAETTRRKAVVVSKTRRRTHR